MKKKDYSPYFIYIIIPVITKLSLGLPERWFKNVAQV